MDAAQAPEVAPSPWRLVGGLLAPLAHRLEDFGRMLALLGDAVRWGVRPPYRVHLFVEAMEFVGVGSLLIVVLVGTFTGMVMALQGVEAARQFQAENYVGSGVALTLTRELAPVLTALMITGRAGSAMATELGSMRITEQIDALDTLAISPVQYLVAPRLVAGLLMLPVMTLVFDVVGMVGAYVVAVGYQGVDPGPFISNVQWYLEFSDVTQGLIKAAVFGLTLALIGCHQGYTASGGAKGVGLATTRAVVGGSVSVLVLDYFLTDIILALT
ncbi:MAG: ABC transporter permease [Myxococcota bacterium]